VHGRYGAPDEPLGPPGIVDDPLPHILLVLLVMHVREPHTFNSIGTCRLIALARFAAHVSPSHARKMRTLQCMFQRLYRTLIFAAVHFTYRVTYRFTYRSYFISAAHFTHRPTRRTRPLSSMFRSTSNDRLRPASR
jgi:hypothetical protein